MTKERLLLRRGAREAFLDGELLDLTSDEFEALLMLVEVRKGDDPEAFIEPEQIRARLSPGADVERVMASLDRKTRRRP